MNRVKRKIPTEEGPYWVTDCGKIGFVLFF
jgi:hypothetical protein